MASKDEKERSMRVLAVEKRYAEADARQLRTVALQRAVEWGGTNTPAEKTLRCAKMFEEYLAGG